MPPFAWQTQHLFDGAYTALRITARPREAFGFRASNRWFISDTLGMPHIEVRVLWVGQHPETAPPLVDTAKRIAEIEAALAEFNEREGYVNG